MFDLQFSHIIKNGLVLYGTRPNFDSLFPHISTVLRDKFFALFQACQLTPEGRQRPIAIDLAFEGKVQSLPMISILLTEQAFETQGLSDMSTDNHLHLLSLQTVDINIYAQDQDVVRILHAIIHASFLQYKNALLKVGYDNLRFVTSSDVEQEPRLKAESNSLSNFKRKLRFSAIYHLYLPMITSNSSMEYPLEVQNQMYTLSNGSFGDVTVKE